MRGVKGWLHTVPLREKILKEVAFLVNSGKYDVTSAIEVAQTNHVPRKNLYKVSSVFQYQRGVAEEIRAYQQELSNLKLVKVTKRKAMKPGTKIKITSKVKPKTSSIEGIQVINVGPAKHVVTKTDQVALPKHKLEVTLPEPTDLIKLVIRNSEGLPKAEYVIGLTGMTVTGLA